MTLTIIEKAAKLMGYNFISPAEGYAGTSIVITDRVGRPVKDFDPLTNKSDLMDLECALEIQIDWFPGIVQAWVSLNENDQQNSSDHPDKFTACAHAVMAVVEQIYDRREG